MWVSYTKWSCLFLTTPNQKSLKQLLAFLNFHKYAKNQFIPLIHYLDTVSFRVPRPDWPHSFLTMSIPKFFDQLLIYVNLYQHAKNQAISLICSGDMVDQKILQSDGRRTFWPISQGKLCSTPLCRIINSFHSNRLIHRTEWTEQEKKMKAVIRWFSS